MQGNNDGINKRDMKGAQLFCYNKHRQGPDFSELGIQDLDCNQDHTIDTLSNDRKVFFVFVHSARMSSNVELEKVKAVSDKVGVENVILLGLAPNNKSDGVPGMYGDDKGGPQYRCLQLAWSPQTRKFNDFKKENSEDVDKMKKICGVVQQPQPQQPQPQPQPQPKPQLNSGLSGFYNNHKTLCQCAVAAVALIAVVCVCRTEMCKKLFSQMLGSVSKGMSV